MLNLDKSNCKTYRWSGHGKSCLDYESLLVAGCFSIG